MRLHKFMAIVLLALAAAQSFASVCATCRALPNLHSSPPDAMAAVQSDQKLAATASNCEFQTVCASASMSIAPAREAELTVRHGRVPPRDIPLRWASRTIKPPIHPPKVAA